MLKAVGRDYGLRSNKGDSMHPGQRARNILRGLVQRHGTESLKRHIWNREYAEGRWKCLEAMPGNCVYPHLEKHARAGSILDLGCGPGAVGNELNAAAYSSYTGVDISDVAIEKARRRTDLNGRTDKNEYFQSDILSYMPKKQYDVILFGDSLYYLPYLQIPGILARYSKYLKPDGVFIVRGWMWKKKHHTTIQDIERNFDVVERIYYGNSQMVLITFRRRCSQ